MTLPTSAYFHALILEREREDKRRVLWFPLGDGTARPLRANPGHRQVRKSHFCPFALCFPLSVRPIHWEQNPPGAARGWQVNKRVFSPINGCKWRCGPGPVPALLSVHSHGTASARCPCVCERHLRVGLYLKKGRVFISRNSPRVFLNPAVDLRWQIVSNVYFRRHGNRCFAHLAAGPIP